jgi:hypothetical protein
MALLVFHFVYAPVRTGHLARERPISYSFSLYLYSWYSGLVILIFRRFLMLGGYKFRVVDGLYWYTLGRNPSTITAPFVAFSGMQP